MATRRDAWYVARRPMDAHRLCIVGYAALLAACGPSAYRPPVEPMGPSASPLGPSYVLIPVPSEDDQLLGRVLPALPEPGRSLEELSRPNPCGEHLTPVRETPMANHFEDAQDVAGSASATAALGIFGLTAEAERASHFLYKISTDRRVSLTDTPEYVRCCEEVGGCGVGFVSALVHGEGEYATGEETSAAGSVMVASASAEGGLRVRVLQRRNVNGFLAALITQTGKEQADDIGPLGSPDFEPSVKQRVLEAYERDKVRFIEIGDDDWALATTRGMLTENEFARKYRQRTGSTELDPVVQRRNWTGVAVSGTLLAGSLYLLYWGITNLKQECTADDIGCTRSVPSSGLPAGAKCTDSEGGVCQEYIDPDEKRTNVAGILALSGGASLTLATGIVFGVLLANGDGLPTNHRMSQDDTRRFVTRYNRKVLRDSRQKVRREVSIEEQAVVDVLPFFGPISGVRGRF